MTTIEKVLLIAIITLCIATIIWLIWSNVTISVNTYIVKHNQIPDVFDGFRILQVSDLHNAEYGKNNSKLVQKIKDSKPDIIVFTGDIVDESTKDLTSLEIFIQELVKIAPCYFATGNHEARAKLYPEFKEFLQKAGVVILEDANTVFEYNGGTMNIAGIQDLSFRDPEDMTPSHQRLEEKLSQVIRDDCFNVVLSHRPEFIETYAAAGAQLVLSGHAHGGQFIIPILGSIYAPGQGLFPEYTRGVYEKDNTQLVVSRGAGPSSFPVRINNQPELVLVALERK